MLPILGSTVLQSLNASVNAMWLGHCLGEAALTATSNATLILCLLLSAVFGVSWSARSWSDRVWARNVSEAKHGTGTSVVFFTAISLGLAVAGFFGTLWMLRVMGMMPADALPHAIAYVRIIFLALQAMYF